MKNTVEEHLITRINYFLSSDRRGRKGVALILKKLSEIGTPILFGGILRDLSFDSNKEFDSDVDIVVMGCSSEELAQPLLEFGLQRNAFGGFRISLEGWDLDIWTLDSTWAFRTGFIVGKTEDDLLKTTFFNWDAIAYLPNEKKLISGPRYFDELENRVLDINFEMNPNLLGIYKRIAKFLYKRQARLTHRLAKYFLENFSSMQSTYELFYSNNDESFAVLASLRRQIENHTARDSTELFTLQPPLFSEQSSDSLAR